MREGISHTLHEYSWENNRYINTTMKMKKLYIVHLDANDLQ